MFVDPRRTLVNKEMVSLKTATLDSPAITKVPAARHEIKYIPLTTDQLAGRIAYVCDVSPSKARAFVQWLIEISSESLESGQPTMMRFFAFRRFHGMLEQIMPGKQSSTDGSLHASAEEVVSNELGQKVTLCHTRMDGNDRQSHCSVQARVMATSPQSDEM